MQTTTIITAFARPDITIAMVIHSSHTLCEHHMNTHSHMHSHPRRYLCTHTHTQNPHPLSLLHENYFTRNVVIRAHESRFAVGRWRACRSLCFVYVVPKKYVLPRLSETEQHDRFHVRLICDFHSVRNKRTYATRCRFRRSHSISIRRWIRSKTRNKTIHQTHTHAHMYRHLAHFMDVGRSKIHDLCIPVVP